MLLAYKGMLVAIERSTEKRAEFCARIGTYDPGQLVFVEESAVDRRTSYRGRAWALRGRKAVLKVFFCCGRRYVSLNLSEIQKLSNLFGYSVLPALSLTEGILHVDILKGTFDTANFFSFVERLLERMNPFPEPNSVIVMDNCRIHKHPDIVDLIESRCAIADQICIFFHSHISYRGMRCEFLPPYSPDYNPIELFFSAMKYHLRRNGQYIRFAMTELADDDIHLALLEAIHSISLQDVLGWCRHCNYI